MSRSPSRFRWSCPRWRDRRGPLDCGALGLLAWQGRDFSRAPGEGAPELQGEQKGIMVARMRARQSATSLLGAQARAGVRPAGKDSQRARETGKQKEVKGRMEQLEQRDNGGEAMDESGIPLVPR